MLCTFCPPTTLGDFYRIPEVAQIVGGQNAQSMRDKRSDPQKDWKFTFSRNKSSKIDERQITHLICARLKYMIYMTFLRGVLGLLPVVFLV